MRANATVISYYDAAAQRGSFETLDSAKFLNSVRDTLSVSMRNKAETENGSHNGKEKWQKVQLENLSGIWHGKARTYNWSKSKVIDSEDMTMVVEKNGQSDVVRFMRDGRIISTFSPDKEEKGRLVATKMPEDCSGYKWLVRSMQARKDDDGRLHVYLDRCGVGKEEQLQPMVVLLLREGYGSIDKHPFHIIDMSPSPLRGKNFSVKVISKLDCTAEVGIFNATNGRMAARCGIHKLRQGENILRLKAELQNGHYVLKVMSRKGYAKHDIYVYDSATGRFR